MKDKEAEIEEGALAALDEALAGGKPDVKAQAADEVVTGLEGPDGAQDEEEPEVAAEATEGDDSNGEAGDGSSAPDEDTPSSNDSAKPASPPPEDAPPETAEPETVAAAPAAPSDQFGELDEKTPEKTRERFQTLKGSYDELHGKFATLEKQSKEWEETIISTGTTPQQFGMALEYLSAVNAQTPEGLEKAYEFLSKEMDSIGRLLGKPVNGYDPLEGHPDLKKKVDEGYLDQADAMEIVQAREVKALPKKLAAARDSQPAPPAMTPQEGISRLAALGAELKAADPTYTTKYASLKPIVEAVVANSPPDTWEKTIRAAYQKLPAPTFQSVPKPKAPTPIRQTQTGSGAGTGMKQTAGSAIEAIDLALGL